MADFPNIPRVGTKGRIILEYSGSDVEYIGLHTFQDASTADISWEVIKLFYTGEDLTGLQVLTGAYDDRATLDWV